MPENTRTENYAIAIAGRKHTGKSTKTATLANGYPTDKKVLVLDVNGSPAYAHIPQIKPEELHRFKKPGKARLLGIPTDATLRIIAENFRDGLLIWEDCTAYISANPKPIIKEFLTNHRMYRVDMIFTFHALKFVPPFFWSMISYIILLKTNETFRKAKNEDRVPNYEEIYEAFTRVKAHKDNYYCETVKTLI